MSRLCNRIPRASPGAVVATLALFLALGGGALAFSGSGKLQKENEIGLPESPAPKEVIRTIEGIGDVRADCVAQSTDNPRVDLQNDSGEALVVRIDRGPGLSWSTVQDGNSSSLGTISQDQLHHYQLSPADGSKRPQATISVAIDDTDDCDTSQVAVLAVTTED